MKKSLIALLLVFSLLLCACGETDNKGGGDSSDPSVTPTAAPVPDIEVTIGEYFKFGSYEQDDDESNGAEEIEWLVLAVEDNKALLISKFILDNQLCNYNGIDMTWEKNLIRKWLNSYFINSAFSASEKKRILDTALTTGPSPTYNVTGGNDTLDKIFLLSYEEALQYFPTSDVRLCGATKYAEGVGCPTYYSDYTVNDRPTSYWGLRSAGKGLQQNLNVDFDGSFDYYGNDTMQRTGVRPAMWINLLPTTPSAEPNPTANPETKANDYIFFGTYDQNFDETDEKEQIEWKVLTVVDDKALIVSKYILDGTEYYSGWSRVTWENCELRTWLNETFLNAAFSSSEQSKIIPTQTEGSATDKVFCLSIGEVYTYFPTDADRICGTTDYAKTKVQSYCDYSADGKNAGDWWLCSSNGDSTAALISYTGEVFDSVSTSTYGTGVRPAMWISLK